MSTPRRLSRGPRAAPSCPHGVELILLLPAVAMLLAGLTAWAGYFQLGCRLQNVADVAATAADHAIGEQAMEQTARNVAVRELIRLGLPPQAMTVFVDRRDGRLTLHLAYEASGPGLTEIKRLLPGPPETIVRMAPIRLGER